MPRQLYILTYAPPLVLIVHSIDPLHIAAMACSYDHHAMPPLTCNSLDQYQRARLIRSTRKLGAVLGTTPRVAEALECDAPTTRYAYAHEPRNQSTKASRRHGSIFTLFPETASSKESMYSVSSSSNSSLVSLTSMESRPSIDVLPTPKPSTKGRRSGETPRPLMLRINAVPVAPTDTRVPLSPIHTSLPMSPTFSDLPAAPSAAEVRRKRMAKLTRTLGENIPPEVVFPPSHTRQAAPVSVSATPRTAQPKRSSQVWITGAKNGTWVGEWNRKDIGEVQKKLRNLKVR